jgi:hypothetical protein
MMKGMAAQAGVAPEMRGGGNDEAWEAEVAARRKANKDAEILNGLDMPELKRIVPTSLEHALWTIRQLNRTVFLAASNSEDGLESEDGAAIAETALLAGRLAEAAIGMMGSEFDKWEKKGAAEALRELRPHVVRQAAE